MARLTPRARAEVRRRHIGFVFQFFHLMPGLTVAENVALPLILDGSTAGSDGRVDRLLNDVGLSHRASHLPGELSGGEMQRAAIARALVAEPGIVLADEPTGNLDSATGAEIFDLLTGVVRERQAALVMVTHDRTAAKQADRVVTLADGRLA
jgi:predicted ABC-type transport system involved in lysophospholipase L1 biosynthesis ATPase subunit